MKKQKLLFFLLLTLLIADKACALTITKQIGWLETAYVTWEPVANANSYNVYYSGEEISNKKIDTQLIRQYPDHFRADVLGLKAGTYTITVKAVNSEGTEFDSATSSSITVKAHDRSGFAFFGNRVPGVYKADGTLKANAVVLYITQNTKDNVSFEVVTSSKGAKTVCNNFQAILDGFKKGYDTRPLILRLIGQIKDPAYMLNGDIVIENNNNASSHITIEGVGDDAVADGWGIRIKNASNIEIRNLGTMNCNSGEGDNIGLQQDNDHIWVHNCDFFYGHAGSDSDQAKGDGALDCKGSTYVTFSYNHFWDSGKCNLLGLSEGASNDLLITYHHNWYDHSDSRHPRVRFYSAHVYNNYYDGNSKYGVGATEGSSVFVENNYFRNCKKPMMISMQGTDVYGSSANDYKNAPTFSKENGGMIKAYNNHIEGASRYVSYGAANGGYQNTTIDFDSYEVTDRNATIPNTIKTVYGNNVYNNFDTNSSIMYSYIVDSPEDAKTNVMQYAGRVESGDFEWTFNNSVDDASYDLNTALKSAITNYKSSLVAIQGEASTGGEEPGGEEPGDPDPLNPTGDSVIHNFTIDNKTSSFFNIAGNMNSTDGNVSYNGLTLTKRLKIESSTEITFTTDKEMVLTLVFDSDFAKKVNIDGVSYSATAGILTMTIPAGAHSIKKGDTTNLFYIALVSKVATNIDSIEHTSVYFSNGIIYNSENTAIQVYDMTGRIIISGNTNIDMTHYTKGIYMIRIVNNNKIIKLRW